MARIINLSHFRFGRLRPVDEYGEWCSLYHPGVDLQTVQEINFSLSSDRESELVARARIASRGERQGWVLMGIDLNVASDTGKEIMSGRATITFPLNGEVAG